MNKKKISTFWDTGTFKYVISKGYLEKLKGNIKIQPFRGIQILSASGNKIEPIGQVTFKVQFGTLKLSHIFI